MSARLGRVHHAGLATVQDGGRYGYEQVGVPAAGALHRARYLLASALLRGEPDASVPAVEILAGRFALSAETDLVLAVVGPAAVHVAGRPAAVGTVIEVATGVEVMVTPQGRGPVYLVVDGWQAARILGSASYDSFSSLGGRPLAPGDVLRGSLSGTGRDRVGSFHRPLPAQGGPLRVVAASRSGDETLLGRTWTVSTVARSGTRLGGGSTGRAAGGASMPVLPGAVQVTPSGEAIILGPDGGLTGGYPVPGVVITADLDRISLLRPGDPVTFAEVSVSQAAGLHTDARRSVSRSLAHPADLHG